VASFIVRPNVKVSNGIRFDSKCKPHYACHVPSGKKREPFFLTEEGLLRSALRVVGGVEGELHT